jgi:hypothetical protein
MPKKARKDSVKRVATRSKKTPTKAVKKAKKEKPKKQKKNDIYRSIIMKVFFDAYEEGATQVSFSREAMEAAKEEKAGKGRNLGDILYRYRYRSELPQAIRDKLAPGFAWIIRGTGPSTYRFDAVEEGYAYIRPRAGQLRIKVPDQTPGIIVDYALNDEQALLAKIRYNRLLDIFTGIAASSLQSHLRTKVPDVGQVEVDEIYVGVDSHGVQYVLPVQAKGRLGPDPVWWTPSLT